MLPSTSSSSFPWYLQRSVIAFGVVIGVFRYCSIPGEALDRVDPLDGAIHRIRRGFSGAVGVGAVVAATSLGLAIGGLLLRLCPQGVPDYAQDEVLAGFDFACALRGGMVPQVKFAHELEHVRAPVHRFSIVAIK